jgi:ATP-dependent helicase HrpA
VPVPDYADACLKALHGRHGSLIEALTTELRRMTGVSVPRDAWRPELLPEHLSACFELFDEQGQQLDSGRDLQRLQERYGQHAESNFSKLTDPRFERDKVTDWDFGALPEFVELQRGGMKLRGYPALAVAEQGIAVRLFDRLQDAADSHREGLLALLRIRAGRVVREILRTVPDLQKQVLWFSPVAGADVLKADLERAVLQAAFLDEVSEVRDAETFNACLSSGRSRLVELAASIGRCSLEALQAYHELNRLLKAAASPQMIAAITEVREQLALLIYPGFVSSTPLPWLQHLARFIRAAAQRLEKLSANVERDRKQSSEVRRHWQRYQQAAAKNKQNPALLDYRWMIEELRVSLFAQQLGTSVKVSSERLERTWEEIAR